MASVGGREWAVAAAAKVEAGQAVSIVVRDAIEAALGRKLVMPSRAKRPDYADRAAGDTSFDDADGVAI